MENSTKTQKEMLSWHKPQVQKLTIIVDTQNLPIVGLQSGGDFAGEG